MEFELVNGVMNVKPSSLHYLRGQFQICTGSEESGKLELLLQSCLNSDPKELKDSCMHQDLLFLHQLYTSAQVSEFLSNEALVRKLVKELSNCGFNLGFGCECLSYQLKQVMFVHPVCIACSTCYDHAGCNHGHTPQRMQCPDPNLASTAHRFMLLAQFTLGLLEWKDGKVNKNVLVNALIAPEVPPGSSSFDHVLRLQLPIICLVSVLGDAYLNFPKATHLACALLSEIIARAPSSSLSLLDPNAVIPAIISYLHQLKFRVSNPECSVEEHFGLVQVLNLAPILYYIADWREADQIIRKYELPCFLSSLAINILHSGQAYSDTIPDVKQHPELHQCSVSVRSLYGDSDIASIIDKKRNTAAFVVLTELLGRWQYRGVDVSTAVIPCHPGPDTTVAESYKEYLPKIEKMFEKSPDTAYLRPVIQTIIIGAKPKQPETGILRGPLLHASMMCALPCCNRTKRDDGKLLLHCSGGCDGLARYCSKEHQREHWRVHKAFCKRSSTIVKSKNNIAKRKKNKQKEKQMNNLDLD